MQKIQVNMTISEIIRLKPKASAILSEFGLGCANCGLGAVETLEEGALAHGLSPEEIDELIEKLLEI